MVRSLGESVSMVNVMENGDVFAGGWDGHLIRWDEEGTILWTAQTGNRISAIAVSDQAIVVTSGLHLVALDPHTGEQYWKVALEGSADDVRWWDGSILAVSSVYDIEHNDFIESPSGSLMQMVNAFGLNEWMNDLGPYLNSEDNVMQALVDLVADGLHSPTPLRLNITYLLLRSQL
jgi:outer membrane protein assembly factor BamB